VRIEYIPPKNYLDIAGIMNYFKKYVEPLGRGRTTVRLVSNELLLESDRPGMLVLAVRLLNITFGKNSSYIMEPMQEWGPGKWYLDMEPDTPEFVIARQGPPLTPPSEFAFEPPPYDPKDPGLERVSKLAVGVDGDLQGIYAFHMSLDAISLISLAKQFIYLSQPEVPVGEGMIYKPTFDHDPRVSRLRVVLTEFPQDVPWAKLPDQRGSS